MGKFAIQCPGCNNYIMAYNGLRGLIKNKITCGSCGTEVNVKSERMISCRCPGCGNMVLYDQGKKTPKCPVCNSQIEPKPGQRMISFSCPGCGVGLRAAEGTNEDYICPLCDTKIDVQKEFLKAAYERAGMISNIKYEGDNNTLVYKFPVEDFNAGTQLIVHESQQAIFLRGGQVMGIYSSVGSPHTLDAVGLPTSDNFYKLPTPDTRATFHAEVYYVNLAHTSVVNWGTKNKFNIFDEDLGFYALIGARGKYNMQVVNAGKLVQKVVGTTEGLVVYGSDENEDSSKPSHSLRKQPFETIFSAFAADKVVSYLAREIQARCSRKELSLLQLEAHMDSLGREIKEQLNEWLEEEYGLYLPNFTITGFVTPKDDPNDAAHAAWMEYQKTFQTKSVLTRQAEAEAAIAEAQQRTEWIRAQTEAQKQIIAAQGEAGARKAQVDVDIYRMKGMGYTYQDETQRQLGLAGMKAMESGLAAGGGSGVASDGANMIGSLATAGVALGAMGTVAGTFMDTMGNVMSKGSQAGQSIAGTGINGSRGINTAGTWRCPVCGTQGLDADWGICPKCCTPRQTIQEPATWDCPVCGTKGLSADWKICPKCRNMKGVETD